MLSAGVFTPTKICKQRAFLKWNSKIDWQQFFTLSDDYCILFKQLYLKKSNQPLLQRVF
jgi:hypothetical protein